jgi:Flp pilus assembly protein TadG
MTEMALLMVVLLAALIGIMDWSWTMLIHQSLVSRASMAARWGAVHAYPTPAAYNSAVTDMVLYGVTPCTGCTPAFGLSATNITINKNLPQPVPYTYTPEDNGAPITTCQVVVTISGYTVNHFTPVFGSSISGRPITATYVYENPTGSVTTCTAP